MRCAQYQNRQLGILLSLAPIRMCWSSGPLSFLGYSRRRCQTAACWNISRLLIEEYFANLRKEKKELKKVLLVACLSGNFISRECKSWKIEPRIQHSQQQKPPTTIYSPSIFFWVILFFTSTTCMYIIEEYQLIFLILDFVSLAILFSSYLFTLLAFIYIFVPRLDKYPGGPEI